jgi:hypothetical protein
MPYKRTIAYGPILLAAFMLAAFMLAFASGGNADAQQPKAGPFTFADLIRMLADQPDHMADRTVAVNGAVTKMKFAKKQDRVRQEFYPLDQATTLKNDSYRFYKIIVIGQLNQPSVAIDPQEKTYAEAPEDFKLAAFDAQDFLLRASAELGKVEGERVGTEMVEGHKASKIRLRFKGSTEEMYFYFAEDLKNLFVKMDSGTIRQIKGSYTVSNVSFDVQDGLFETPRDYKRVEFQTMLSTIRQKALQ